MDPANFTNSAGNLVTTACPQAMERNIATARDSWARQHAGQLLSIFLFPVGHPMSAGCTPHCDYLRQKLTLMDLREKTQSTNSFLPEFRSVAAPF